MRFAVFLLCILPLVAAISYEDTNSWAKEYPTCGGSRQSPISINTQQAVKADLPALKFKHYNENFSANLTIKNNGYTMEFDVPTTVTGQKPSITGGLLNGEYTAESVQFHWGLKYKPGSEHELNGRRYPLEMHIVHKNSKYSTVEEAREYEDGLALVGVFFEDSYQTKIEVPGAMYILGSTETIQKAGSTTETMDDISLGSLLGSVNGKPYITGEEFYTYQGSLTTPPCSESVTWILFPRPVPVTIYRLNGFYKLKDTNGQSLVNNFRPFQPIGDRQVYHRTA